MVEINLNQKFDLIWDCLNEPITLGGALVLRQEGEILATLNNVKEINLYIKFKKKDYLIIKRIIEVIFFSSNIVFKVIYKIKSKIFWPPENLRILPSFSYFSFLRLEYLYKTTGILPRLQWKNKIISDAKIILKKFDNRLICIHLKYKYPFRLEDNNANGPIWEQFFKDHEDSNQFNFLLIGDDKLPLGLKTHKGVYRGCDFQIPLQVQLALISISNGFLGMASGICTAANLSSVPHVIFKHPYNHIKEMNKELGRKDSFSFAQINQKLWRSELNSIKINDALKLITLKT